jgi:membrane protein YdbS with pleckstrin-like domain
VVVHFYLEVRDEGCKKTFDDHSSSFIIPQVGYQRNGRKILSGGLMMASDPSADPSQRDLAWVGYHPRAAAPVIVLAAIVSVLVLSGRWYLDGLSELADRAGALAVFALAWAVWPGLLAVFLYRTVTYTYRLTDRAVLVDFGFLSSPTQPINLAEVISVSVRGGFMTRWLGVGRVELRTKNQTLGMSGVRHPELFAMEIRSAAGACRKT